MSFVDGGLDVPQRRRTHQPVHIERCGLNRPERARLQGQRPAQAALQTIIRSRQAPDHLRVVRRMENRHALAAQCVCLAYVPDFALTRHPALRRLTVTDCPFECVEDVHAVVPARQQERWAPVLRPLAVGQ